MSVPTGQTRLADPRAALRRVELLLARHDAAAADALCGQLLKAHPALAPALLLRARARQMAGDFPGMLACASQAADLPSEGGDAQRMLAEAQIYNGDIAGARQRLAALEQASVGDPRSQALLAELHARLNDHRAAHRCHARARGLAPDDPGVLFNLASSLVAVGDLAGAETCLDRLIERRPTDFDAWYNRATLRRQTPTRSHVAAIEAALATAEGGERGAVALNYALAKELEDLGEYRRAWQALSAGAAARRRRLAYDVAGDEATLAQIRTVFDAKWLAQEAPRAPATESPVLPVFVAGLPRSGTTLVERILSSHSRVDALGEISDLALALTRLSGVGGGRVERVTRAARIDPARLGEAYRTAIRGYGARGPFLLDKTPLNVLYFGLIHRALPEARLIHVRRHPLDVCLAMFKTLFRMGYPFSYDLDDLARYYLAYDALMAHWRAVLPAGRFLEVDYESLVADQSGISRALLAHAGLEWEDACLQFHANPAPSATASAAQVRQPIYHRAVGRWQHYAEGLAPLAERLVAAGIDVPQTPPPGRS